MQTVAFTCNHCNNLMAVGMELLGQQVHCPTCGQIVVAPLAAPAPVPVVPSDAGLELTLDMPKRETHESIFSDEDQDDDLFGSRKPKVEMPAEPAPADTVPPPSPNGSGHTGFAAYPPGVPAPPLAAPVEPAPTVSLPEALPEPPSPAPIAPPPLPSPPAGTPDSFWSKASGSALPASSQQLLGNAPSDPAKPPSWGSATRFPDVEGQAADPAAATTPRRQRSNLLATIVVPYAILVTAVAAYYMWRHLGSTPEVNSLEAFPDAIRIIDKPISPKNKGAVKLPAQDSPLAEKLKIRLGQKIEVGDLEVTPLRIEQGRLTVYSINKEDQIATTTTNEALTLVLRIRNRSASLAICPTDPMYDRSFNPEFTDDNAKPYTLIDVGTEKFYGGAIDVYNPKAKREYVSGQDNDDHPLGPGEERLTVTCSNPRNDRILPAVNGGKQVMTWRVQLRKGVVAHRGRDIPVCTVIGVEFTAADIQKVAKN